MSKEVSFCGMAGMARKEDGDMGLAREWGANRLLSILETKSRFIQKLKFGQNNSPP